MTSKIECANRALSKLGEQRITDISSDIKSARAVNAAFNIVRDRELRAHGWSFAMKRAQLAASVDAPLYGFAYSYPMPADLLRIWELGEWYWSGPDQTDYRNGSSAPYSVEGRNILTSETRSATVGVPSPLNIRYIAQVDDTNQWDACFVEAFACKLAIECCSELTQSATKKSDLWGEYKVAVGEAQRVNAIELPPEYVADDSWLMSRLR